MAREAVERGFDCDVREPIPEHPGQWAVVCETYVALTSDFVRGTGNFFDDLAGRHTAEYDGWEASV